MTLKDAFRQDELPDLLADLSHVIDMVDGWALRNESIDYDLAMYAASLIARIANEANPQ